jgi:hypothetical protein
MTDKIRREHMGPLGTIGDGNGATSPSAMVGGGGSRRAVG